jgi:hypothetical protein
MYFSKSYRYNLRTKCIHQLHQFLLSYFSHYPPHVLEFIIKSIHFQCIFIAFSSLFILPFILFQLTFIIFLLLFLLFFYFDGCILTCIEYKLCSNKSQFINVMDPFLYFFQQEIHPVNQYFLPIYFSTFYFFSSIIKLLFFSNSVSVSVSVSK